MFFFCVALLDKRVASWSSVSNFSNSATLRCACLLPICLLGMLNDLGCFFLLKINKYLCLCITYCVQRPLALLRKTFTLEKEFFSIDYFVMVWSSVPNFSTNMRLQCACLLLICLLEILNDLRCFFIQMKQILVLIHNILFPEANSIAI